MAVSTALLLVEDPRLDRLDQGDFIEAKEGILPIQDNRYQQLIRQVELVVWLTGSV